MDQQSPQQEQTNFQLLRLYFQNAFIKYFESINQQKSVFFEETLLKVLSFVIGNPPPSAKISQSILLTDKSVDITQDTVVFVIRPDLETIRTIVAQKKLWNNVERDIYILFIPRRTIECDEELEKEDLFQEDKVSQIAMDLIPLEDDLLSLELQDNFQHYMLGDDDSYKIYVQNSINRLETIFGQIKFKYAKGDDSCQIIQRLAQSQFQVSTEQQENEIDCLFLIDRNIDLISPFCVSQTYEGQLDENFQIKTCTINVDTGIVKPDASKDANAPPNIMLLLTSEDVIFKEVRDLHFATLERIFTSKLQQIQNIVKEKDAPTTIDELESYINKLRNMNIAKGKDMIAHHVNLAFHMNSQMKNLDYQHVYGLEQKIILGEDIKSVINTLEIKMAKQYNQTRILRLLCLLCQTQSGLKKEDFDLIRKQYIQNYGYQQIITLMNMQDAKLLKVKDKKFDWSKLKKVFKLINEEVRINDPVDISYVFNGYAPLSVRFIEHFIQANGFKNFEDKLKLLPGLTSQPYNEHELFPQSNKMGQMEGISSSKKKRKFLIYYIGGITYAEIAAIRFLNKLFPDKKFIIATTQIINGDQCVEMIRGNVNNNLSFNSLLKK